MAGNNTATRAARNRAVRQSELREKLAAGGHIQHVLDIAKKLANESLDINSVMTTRLKASADLQMKLVDKYLPNLKAIEMTGEDGKELFPGLIRIVHE